MQTSQKLPKSETILLESGSDFVELIGEIRINFGKEVANYLHLAINSGNKLQIKVTSGAISYAVGDTGEFVNVNELPERGLFGLIAQVKSDASKYWENGNGKISNDFAQFRREEIISEKKILFQPQIFFDYKRFFRKNIGQTLHRSVKTNLLEFRDLQVNRRSGKFEGWKCDINAAYWNIANEIFLSENTYKNGLNKKSVRLKALGALATEYRNYLVDNNQLLETRIERGPYANLFTYIANLVIDKMVLFSTINPNIFGYYVDCFFIQGTEFQEIKYFSDIFEQYTGLKLKYEKCSFEFLDNDRHILLHAISHFQKNEFGKNDEKMYFCPK